MTGVLLPTLPNLGISSLSTDCDALEVATKWLVAFSAAATAGDVDGVTSLFIRNAIWRDLLALTWDFRTFTGENKIRQFLYDRLKPNFLKGFSEPQNCILQLPMPDLAWVQFTYTFTVAGVGSGSGVVRLVPQKDGIWRCHCLLTNLEDLEGSPGFNAPLRSDAPNHGLWEAQRQHEMEFTDSEPTVLIVGAGQSGLDIAARFKYLGVSCLMVEKNARVGDNWRNRYDALCLHDPVWYDHMPYIPFPKNWPVYCPARKLANWLESYAVNMELNVWTSTTVLGAVQEQDNKWAVTVRRDDGTERVLRVNHLISAVGLASSSITGSVEYPSIPGMDKFKGQLLHSFQHKSALDHTGKKVVVVGSCTSAHDICDDYYKNGIDVTMYQRSSTYVMSAKNGFRVMMAGLYEEGGPPTEMADLLNASFPNVLMKELAVRQTAAIAELDKPILDALRARGFKTNKGYKDAGFLLLAWERAGGYYIDVGTSQLIADGKIKLKADSLLKEFTETGLLFEDGTEVSADVVVFATGLGKPADGLKSIVGEDVVNKCSPLWGLNPEGEIYGSWRDLGLPGLWSVAGNLALCRFYSKHMAMQIKAIESGRLKERYALPLQ